MTENHTQPERNSDQPSGGKIWPTILICKPNTKTDRITLQSERETTIVTGILGVSAKINSNTRRKHSETYNSTKRKLTNDDIVVTDIWKGPPNFK